MENNQNKYRNPNYSPNYGNYYPKQYEPGIVDFGQLNFYNPADTEFLAQIGANRQQRFDVAQGELTKQLEKISSADFSALPQDVRSKLELELDKDVSGIYDRVIDSYGGDFGRALPEIVNTMARDRKLLYEGEQENKRYAQALAEYQSLAAQGKSPRKIVVEPDENTGEFKFVPKVIPFEEYHELPSFDDKGNFIPGIYNPLRGAGEHEQFIRTNFSNEIGNMVRSITPSLKTVKGVGTFVDTGSIKGKSEEEIEKMIFNSKGELTPKGKQMVETFRNSPQAEAEFGEQVYKDDKMLGKYLVDVISSQVYQSVIDNYSPYSNSTGGGGGGDGSGSSIIQPIDWGTIGSEEDIKRVNKDIKILKDFSEKGKGFFFNLLNNEEVKDKDATALGEGVIAQEFAEEEKEREIKLKPEKVRNLYRENYGFAIDKMKKEGISEDQAILNIAEYRNEKLTGRYNLFFIQDQEVNNFLAKAIVKSSFGPKSWKEIDDEGNIKNKEVDAPNIDNVTAVAIDVLGGGFVVNTKNGKKYALNLYQEKKPYLVAKPTPKDNIAIPDPVKEMALTMSEIGSLYVNGTKNGIPAVYGKTNEIIEVDGKRIKARPVYILESDYKNIENDRIQKAYVNPSTGELIPNTPVVVYNSMDGVLKSLIENMVESYNPYGRGIVE